MPRRILIAMVAQVVVGAVVGVVLLLRGQTALGVFLLVAPALVSGVNVTMIRRSSAQNQPGAPRGRGALTGRRLVPHPSSPRSSGADGPAWTGGANVMARIGRANATWPLAVLAVRGATLTLRFRPRPIAAFVGTAAHSWTVDDLLVVYPVRGRLVALNRGIAIESRTRPLAYFWTLSPEPILAALAARGMPVDWAERTIRLWR